MLALWQLKGLHAAGPHHHSLCAEGCGCAPEDVPQMLAGKSRQSPASQICSSALKAPWVQAGFGVAVEYALSVGLDQIWERVQGLAAYLRQSLQQVPGVTVTDKGRRLCGIVSFVQVCACQLLAGLPVLVVPLLSRLSGMPTCGANAACEESHSLCENLQTKSA